MRSSGDWRDRPATLGQSCSPSRCVLFMPSFQSCWTTSGTSCFHGNALGILPTNVQPPDESHRTAVYQRPGKLLRVGGALAIIYSVSQHAELGFHRAMTGGIGIGPFCPRVTSDGQKTGCANRGLHVWTTGAAG